MSRPDKDSHRRGVSRRRFVEAAGASGVAVGVAGCLGFGGGGGGGGGSDVINTEAPSEEVSVQFASDSNFKGKQDAINQALYDAGMPENITVEMLAGSFDSGDRQSKYQQALNAGQEQPTIMMMDNGWTIPFIARESITNLSQAFPDNIVSEVKDTYLDSMVATASMDGDLYGIPLFADFPTIQYRKDLLREAGYSDSDFETWATESMTWQEFSEVVRAAMDETGKQGFTWQGASYVGLACCDFVEFMSSWGGAYFGGFDNLFGPVGDRPITVDEEQVVNAVRMMRTFIHGQDDSEALEGYAEISPEAVVQYKEETSRKPFTNGEVVAHRNWPYSILINAADDVYGEDLGVMPIPYEVTAEESKYGPEIGGIPSALGGWHVTLNPNAPELDKRAAFQVMKTLATSDQVKLDLFEIGGWIPPAADLINSDAAKELDVIGRYVDTLAVAGQNAVPRPVTAIWPQQSTQVSKEVNAAIKQDKTPQKAMSDLAGALEDIEAQA